MREIGVGDTTFPARLFFFRSSDQLGSSRLILGLSSLSARSVQPFCLFPGMAGNCEIYHRFLLLDKVTLTDLCKLCDDEDHVRSYCFKTGLLGDFGGDCPKCGEGTVTLRKDSSAFDGYKWRCSRTKNCSYKLNIREKSFFDESRLKIGVILKIVYHWCWGHTLEEVRHEVGISGTDTAVNWYSYCREVCEQILIEDNRPVGGPGLTVEIDESKYGKRKYNRGRRVEGQWVFGGICREDKNCFLVTVPDRSSDTLIPIINTLIAPGSTINSDCWASYNSISAQERQYIHKRVNHSIEFVTSSGPDIGTHTNLIESTWRASKGDLPKTGTQKQLLQSYLWVYCVKKRYLGDKTSKFKSFIELIKRVYKVPRFDNSLGTPRKDAWIYKGKYHKSTQTEIPKKKPVCTITNNNNSDSDDFEPAKKQKKH